MTDMKCPFCGQELEDANIHSSGLYFECPNCYDKQKEKDDNYTATPKVWQELIRTRKALDVAVDAFNRIDETRSVANHKIGTQDKTLNSGIVFCWTTPDEIHNTIAEITALEQKE